jgi:4-hydroxy-tetrahydrodipicolinate reductase
VTVRLAIAGAGGRMGQALIEAALADPDLALVGALDVAGSPALGRDVGERLGRATGVVIGGDVAKALQGVDVLIDFTRPEGTVAHVAACEAAGVAAVVGTTGLSQAQQQKLAASAARISIVFAPNMSVGVNVLADLVRVAAQRLGPGYDVEVLEMHHRHKVDAPSGTALLLGQAAAQGLGVKLDEHAVYERHGVTGARKAGTIGFAALRGGDVVGEHTVIFAGTGERVELTHKAASRQNFAMGALRAARFVADQRARNAPGLYDMADVLGLRARQAPDASG